MRRNGTRTREVHGFVGHESCKAAYFLDVPQGAGGSNPLAPTIESMISIRYTARIRTRTREVHGGFRTERGPFSFSHFKRWETISDLKNVVKC